MTGLDAENAALKGALLVRMLAHSSASASSSDDAPSACDGLDLFLAEFGGARLRVQVQEGDLSTILLSLGAPPYSPEIVTSAGLPIGAIEAVREEYKGFAEPLATPEPGYHLTLRVDMDQLPPEPEARAAIASSLAQLRAVAMGAPLRDLLRPLQGGPEARGGAGDSGPSSAMGIVTAVPYGDKSALLVLPQEEHVEVFWPVALEQPRDAVLARVFLEVRRSISSREEEGSRNSKCG